MKKNSTKKAKKRVGERKFYYSNNITEAIVAMCNDFRERYPYATLGECEAYYRGLMDGVAMPNKLKK